MSISHFLKLMLLPIALALPNIAAADEIEVRSENVIFVGDVSEAQAKQLVKNLEIYRSTILSLVGITERPDKRPLRVYGVKNSSSLAKFTGTSGAAGLYTEGLQGPVFVTITKGGFDNGKWAVGFIYIC